MAGYICTIRAHVANPTPYSRLTLILVDILCPGEPILRSEGENYKSYTLAIFYTPGEAILRSESENPRLIYDSYCIPLGKVSYDPKVKTQVI